MFTTQQKPLGSYVVDTTKRTADQAGRRAVIKGFALLAAFEWSNTRAAPTVCLCVGALGVDIRICRW